MPSSTHRTVTQWLLLCVLFVGVVGMHHVATSSDTQTVAAHQQHSQKEPSSPAHDVLHICVAVLGAVVSLLLLAWLLVRSTHRSGGRTPVSSAWPRAPDHPPPISGRALLGSLCVLRL